MGEITTYGYRAYARSHVFAIKPNGPANGERGLPKMRWNVLSIFVLFFLSQSVDALAHGGGLDGMGCHHNKKQGGYHCHQGQLAGQEFLSKGEALNALQASEEKQPGPIEGSARVVDGDTIWIGKTKIRLWAIDAPETKQECHRKGVPWMCGEAATERLRAFIGSQPVSCEDRGMDRYKRMIGKCSVGSLDLGAEMVTSGMALPYWQYGGDYYQQAFREARGQGVGMFAGTFAEPWEWRKK